MIYDSYEHDLYHVCASFITFINFMAFMDVSYAHYELSCITFMDSTFKGIIHNMNRIHDVQGPYHLWTKSMAFMGCIELIHGIHEFHHGN